MYRILLTGFLPFGGESVNPSLEAVRSIQVEFPNVELIRLEVPTIFGEAERMVIEQVSFCRPHAVLCTGLASGRTDVSIERVAINVDDARIPDTAGQQPLDVPIQPHGPAAYFSTLPIKSIAQAILSAGVPVEISNTAGTYVCNHLMYQVLHAPLSCGKGGIYSCALWQGALEWEKHTRTANEANHSGLRNGDIHPEQRRVRGKEYALGKRSLTTLHQPG